MAGLALAIFAYAAVAPHSWPGAGAVNPERSGEDLGWVALLYAALKLGEICGGGRIVGAFCL